MEVRDPAAFVEYLDRVHARTRRVVALIPEAERRFMTEIPLAASGPWEPGAREALRAGLAAADARKPGA